jgi:hypothetical protein
MMGFHSVGSRSDLEPWRSEGILPRGRLGRTIGMGLEGDVTDDVEESMLMGEDEGEVIVYVYEEAERGLHESLRRQLYDRNQN